MIGRIRGLERFVKSTWKFVPDELRPIRAQLFTPEKLIEQAKILAESQRVDFHRSPDPILLHQFRKNRHYLQQAYQSINEAVSSKESIPPAEEWFIDNYHVIAEQLKGIEEDLPRKFYLELPSLVAGPLRGYPRTYEMAMQLIAHTDSRLDPGLLRDFISSFQTVSVLTTGELWAFAILLRVGLIENLKRLILISDQERDARVDANRFAEALLQATDEQEVQQVLRDRERDPRAIRGAFAVQLILRLREQAPIHFSAIEWLHDKISKEGMNADEMIRRKHQDLAAAQVTVSNVILSLRLLATMDWAELVEEVSFVDLNLRNDPSGHYSECDFMTRDNYRHVIEQIARYSKKSETDVARVAVRLASASMQKNAEDIRKAHVGYYLVDRGRHELELLTGFRPTAGLSIKRFAQSHPSWFYHFPIALLTLLILSFLWHYSAAYTLNTGLLLLMCIVCVIPCSALAILIINWLVTLIIRPKVLPKFELKNGVPGECRTFVVLPMLLTTPEEIQELVGRLEVHYLANNEDALDFALLADFQDSLTETTTLDEKLLIEAKHGIGSLNSKYPRAERPRFHLFYRKRLWNPAEGRWMGWERKRGKLEEFNRLLLGESHTSYVQPEIPRGETRFVITADADTVLPRDSARKLIGTLMHPLNSPEVDPEKHQVCQGYGILQPRVSHTLTSANRTGFSKIFSGATGIDPYTSAVSDIYQDLFRSANYIGKGIYDLRAFYQTVQNRFPENALLSHDLIEGSYANTGLVTDIEIFDDFPSDYTSFITRLHRWVRGDWQVAPWLLPRVKDRSGKSVPNTLSWLNRWKLLDNLRRSLVSPTLFLTLFFGWTIFPGSATFWSLFVAAVLFSPFAVSLLSGIISPLGDVPILGRLWATLYDAGVNAFQCSLQLSFLANEAFVMSDAILRTIYRLIRHTRLLEWTTAAQAESVRGRDLVSYINRMYGSHILTLASFLALLATHTTSNPGALQILTLWIASPVFAYVTGLEIPRKERKLSEQEVRRLRKYAREIWRFFETFVTDETNWLPPDNFQEIPEEMVAHRTSPTNVGFLLLANISAYDLGYIGATEFVERTEKTLNTLTRLKTFNGHLFNWYDTKTLNPLEPRYVSTVDSGNLVGALIVLKQFTYRFGTNIAKSFDPRPGRFEGVRDTVRNFINHAQKAPQFYEKNVLCFQRVQEILKVRPADSAEQEQVLLKLKEQIDAIASATRVENPESELDFWFEASRNVVATHLADYARPQDIPRRLLAISREAEEFASEIDFQFLYNEERGVFSIGFNVTNGQLDRSCYDLFASESRLGSFVAIAKGDVPQSHWFRMARGLVSIGRKRICISWSGSVFEYLMPLLFLRSEPFTLQDETCRGAVEVHILYARTKHIPWGISEAAYNVRDKAMNYQYGPFGVPKLGLKRGLADNLIVAPYATFLAALVYPSAAIKNLDHLEKYGMRARFGFYESIDFTKDRLPKGEKFTVVKTFMAHHQGMSLIALANLLYDDIIQKHFHSEPAVQATELLLQEKVPLVGRTTFTHAADERKEIPRTQEPVVAREFRSPNVTPPRTQLLSNGDYLTMLTTAGSGYSECAKLRVSRWREDVTRDHWGNFIYVKNLESGELWSAGFQPVCKVPDFYHVVFSEDRVEFRRRDGAIETHTDIIVSPEDNVELRRITIVNTSSSPVEIEATSYLEVVLNTAAADLAHPAFGNLFVETEFVPEVQCLLASRRPQLSNEPVRWAAHVLMCEDEATGELEYETDRARFIGRTRDLSNPHSSDAPLSRTIGAVLDPIFSLRRKIRIEPYSRAVFVFTTLMAKSREEAIGLSEKYSTTLGVQRAFELAHSHAQVVLRQLSVSIEEAHLFQRIAGRLIYSDLSLRARQVVLASNKLTQAGLWAHGISGDLPICLVRIEDATDLDAVRLLLRAHEYWRWKGFPVDLVILNEYPSSYFQELQEQILSLVRSSPSQMMLDQPGGIFVRRADLMTEEERILLRTVARVVIVGGRGSLARQVARVESKDPLPPAFIPLSNFPMHDEPLPINLPPRLLYDNSFGGFTDDGREYVVLLKEGTPTPVPWINVVANANFGFQVSETGAGMTWSINSRENRLTPWSNDPISDPVDSAIYIRDDESGKFWSPTLLPAPGKGAYLAAHGIGYSRFHHGGAGIEQELTMFVPVDQPVKILKLRLRNQTRRKRWLSVTYFVDLILGNNKAQSRPFVITSIDASTGAIFAMNPYNNEFAGRVVFVAMNDRKRTVTTDRNVFLGPNGDPANPAAMSFASITGPVGAGLDPCAVVQGKVILNPLSEHTVLFLLGEAADAQTARVLIERYTETTAVDQALAESSKKWDSTVGAIQVQTPDTATNLLLNRWLFYQALTCRFWSRSAFYQSSGAYGFRDQLQDALAFVYSRPELLREHLLRAAGRQFREGDVQHWWHPPSGRGVRTRSSDDLLWLPYCTNFYVRATGDYNVLQEQIPFLEAPPLKPDEMEVYDQPTLSKESASLYEHCLRAIDRSLKFGSHELPLIGSGDWNDGMNRLGIEGKGESVWLGWFLIRILKDFSAHCDRQNEEDRGKRYRETADRITSAIEKHAWDGEWYRRAFDDHGEPVGSKQNNECQIDSIAQSWAVLSGAGNPERIRQAMKSVEQKLVLPEHKMALLLTPPFANTPRDPGYIKGYLAGIRENGGHYSHAAIWLAAAYAELGDGDKAGNLFSMISPISHSLDAGGVNKYKVEPYVVVADIYSHPAHLGRGGWSWYTGSAAWLYRVGIEWILGFRLHGDCFTIDPCIPKNWGNFELVYLWGRGKYHIRVENPEHKNRGVTSITLDGTELQRKSVPLNPQPAEHQVLVRL